MKRKHIVFFIICLCALNIFPQEEYTYVEPDDSLVQKKLEQWQDIKFGLMMHWGPYSQWGVLESWTICSEDWIRRKDSNYTEYKARYEKLKDTFNPVDFNPRKWAEAAKKAGMKYVVFTTKHHDGFSMFDTKQTDYSITDEGCPFHTNKKANITKEIFNSFRNQGFMIGAYFSKPDWHNNDYWWQYYATPDRNVNYDISKHPEKWQRFVDFTHNQIDELMTGYGKIDILWLDGGWVKKYTEEEMAEKKEKKFFKNMRLQSQDINMPLLAKNARAKQPGLIVVDRTVSGPYENYLTPENKVPEEVINHPWETCMTMGHSWSYNPHDEYKSSRRLIHLLVDVVAKGGNFLLNIGPSPNGDFAPEVYERLDDIAEWMKINSEAIYNTRPVEPYKENKVCFTSLEDGTIYAIYLADEDENQLPEKLIFTSFIPSAGTKIELLGADIVLEGNTINGTFVINFPGNIRDKVPDKCAWTLKFSK